MRWSSHHLLGLSTVIGTHHPLWPTRSSWTTLVGIHHWSSTTAAHMVHVHAWATTASIVTTGSHVADRATGSVVGRWHWVGPCLLLALELVQRLLRGQCHHGHLSVKGLLRHTVHAETHARLGTHGDGTEALGLTIGAILEELDLLEVVDADLRHCVQDVLVGGPLGRGEGVNMCHKYIDR